MKRVGVLGLLLNLLAASPHAASAAARPLIQSSADPTRATNGEMVKFNVLVRYEGNAPVRAPRMPVLAEWRAINAYDSQSVSSVILNGRITTRYTYEYTWLLKPLRAGKLVIPAMDLYVGTTPYKTDPMTIQVDRVADGGQGGAPPPMARQAPHEDEEEDPWGGAFPRGGGATGGGQIHDFQPNDREVFFVRAEPSSTKVYQGEMITITYALYEKNQGGLANPEIAKFPDFKGFLKKELFVAKSFSHTPVQVQGRPYFRSELVRYAVFPLKAGALKIEPLVFKAEYMHSPIEDLMNNMMGRMLPGRMGTVIPMTKSTQALSIDAKPLPPAPAGAVFTGGVGQFQMEVKPPTGNLVVEQPFTVQLTVAGSGNVDVITEPPLVLPKSLESYQTKSHHEIREDATGYKNFEYLILPHAAGPQKIDPLRWTYFDPRKAQYVTLTGPPLEFTIEGGSTPAAKSDASAPVPAARAPSWGPLAVGPQDFVPTRAIGATNFAASKAAAATQALLYALCALVWVRRKNESDLQSRYRKSPWEKTSRRLLEQSNAKPDQIAILLDQWTRERLAGFLDRPDIHAESARDEFLQALRERLHVEHHRHLDPLKKFWSELDVLRFTGGGASGETMGAKTLLDRAEKIVQPILKGAG